jgi:hypothetical protein
LSSELAAPTSTRSSRERFLFFILGGDDNLLEHFPGKAVFTDGTAIVILRTNDPSIEDIS